jgi:ABC-type ATPase with predicted acetyltransferase domain
VPISLLYGEKDLNMTTLQAASLSALEIGSSGNSSGGNDIASRINQLTKQLTKATQQLKELGLSDASEEKQKQQELLESQITMLQAQLAQLQRQQAEERCLNRALLRQ